MTNFTKQNGLFLPKQKEQKKQPTQWNCPWCGYYFDVNKHNNIEEVTVGTLRPDGIPHITCPKCKKCMGCIAIYE